MKKWFKNLKKESGAITVMTAIMLTVVIGFTALSIDIGLHYYRGARLQNAADAAATAVAGSLGSIDTSLEDVAYDYLKRNGFDREKYGVDSNGDPRLKVKIERKGEVDLESVEDETYIKAGYYKVTVTAEDDTLLARIVDVDSLKLEKVAYVKAEANYVAMPRALSYTIFGGSTSGTPTNPTVQLNGRTSKIINFATYITESGINLINSAIVQPLIGFFGGESNYNQLVSINLSEIVDNGDVHSNSNIGVGVQALNISRLKDQDYEGEQNIEAYEKMELGEEDYEPAFRDYGQVTFTACDDIRFNYLQNSGLLGGGYADAQTRVYVQNQQYIEITQCVISILDLISLSNVNNTPGLQSAFRNAATIYLDKQPNIVENQKNKIKAQEDNLEYGGVDSDGRTIIYLKNQGSIVYKITASEATDALQYMRENGIDGLNSDLRENGIDEMYTEGTTDPKFKNYADKGNDTSSMYNLIKRDEFNEIIETNQLTVTGQSVSRNYTKLRNNGRLSSSIETGMKYAVARSFVENSEYIEIPNLKPYFTRQINKSIRNATKSREKMNVSDAGSKNIKDAVKTKTNELNDYLEDLSFEDKTYDDVNDYVKYDKTVLFKTFKDGSETGLTKLKNNSVEIDGSMMNYSYSNIMTDKTYKGFQLYDSNDVLKTPLKFVQEYKNANTSKYASGAISSFYNSTAKQYETAVADKKTDILNTVESYDAREELVKNAIRDVTKPTMTNEAQDDPEPKIDFGDLPNLPDIFLGDGTTGSGVEIGKTDGQRKVFDDTVTGYGVTITENTSTNTCTYNIPAYPSGYNVNSSEAGGRGHKNGLALANNTHYSKTLYTPYNILGSSRKSITASGVNCSTVGIVIDHDIGLELSNGANVHTGSITVDGGDGSYVKVTGNSILFVHGDINLNNKGKIEVDAGSTIVVSGKISSSGSGSGTMSIKGTVVQLSKGSDGEDVNSNHINVDGGSVYAVGQVNSDHSIIINGGTLYTLDNIRCNNGANENDIIKVTGTSNIFVRGVVTTLNTNSAKSHVYFESGSNSILSILGNGYDDCFDNKCSQIHASNNGITGTKIYLGKNTTIYDNNVNTLVGSLYCYGNLTWNTNSTITLTGSNSYSTPYRMYVWGDFSSTEGTLAVSKKYLIRVDKKFKVNTVTCDDSKISVKGAVTVNDKITLSSGSYLEGLGGVPSDKVTGDTVLWPETMTFSNDANGSNIADLVYNPPTGGTVTLTGLNLTNVRLKINGDLIVNGNINITTTSDCKFRDRSKSSYIDENWKSQLYVTGHIYCTGSISSNLSEIYADEGIGGNNGTPTYIGASNDSLILCRKRNINDANSIGDFFKGIFEFGKNQIEKWFTLDSVPRASISCNGPIEADNSSRVYVEGRISAKSVKAGVSSDNASYVYGFYGVNITESADSDGNTGKLASDGENSVLFCGEKSNSGNYVPYIYANGYLYYPTAINSNHVQVGSNGYAVFLGNVTANGYYLVDTGGYYYCEGVTKIVNYYIKNKGEMYLIGGFDYSQATKNRRDDIKKTTLGISSHDYYKYYCDIIFDSGSVSYLGHEVNSNGTFNFSSYYDSRGDVYFEDSISINNYLPIDSDCKDLNGEKPDFPNRGVAVYIPNGITYVDGSVSVVNDNAIYIKGSDGGLIAKNDINYGCAIYNYGKFFTVNGNLNLRSSATWVTDKKEQDKQKEGMSIKNGNSEDSEAQFYVGGTNGLDFLGYIKNYGYMYLNVANNKTLNIKGFCKDDNGADGDEAFINYKGAQFHCGGSVALNSNQLFNQFPYSESRDTVFSCGGKLTYGGCLYNCGKVYVDGDITNNESTTANNKSYRTGEFSLFNGMYVINKKEVKDSFKDYINHDAVLYCTGKLEVGTDEDKGNSGSVVNVGTMFVGSDLNIFTNGPLMSKNRRSYFRIGLWLINNSNTFVGGSTFVGAGAAFAKDTIFMTGGDMRTKRSLKLGVNMFMDKSTFGTKSVYHINLDDTNPTQGTNTAYNSSYMYVGGSAYVNTIGSMLSVNSVELPLIGQFDFGSPKPTNCSRNTNIYANSNIYIGGWWYNNAKLYIKENCSIMVAGKGYGFYNSDGSLKDIIYKPAEPLKAPQNIGTNGTAVLSYLSLEKDKHQACKFYIYQSLDVSPCSKLIVHGGGKVRDTVKIRDMTKTYFYGDFEGDEYVELGKSLPRYVASENKYKELDETAAATAKFKEDGENDTYYEFANSPYMYVGGNFTSGSSGVISSLLNGKIFQIFKEAFFSTGYTKVYASATLKCKGAVTSNKYITLRHDARIYSKGDMTAKTSIEGGNYSEFYVGGSMNAGSSALTTIIDTLDILDLSNRGTIDLRDQVRCIVGGDMYSTKHIQIGELADGSYTRGRKLSYGVGTVTEGSEGSYNDDDITEKVCPNSGCGKPLDDEELQNHHCKDCNKDFDMSQFDAGADGNGTSSAVSDATTIDTSTELEKEDNCPYCHLPLSDEDFEREHCSRKDCDKDLFFPWGANVFIQGSMVALNGHIKEFMYSSVVVGKYVYCPDNIELKSNSDLWVLPETFGNSTYQYLPYTGVAGDTLLSKIINLIKKAGYEIKQALMAHDGSIYTLGQLTLYKNASLLGTYDCVVPGQCVLRKDSLIYLGHNFTCTAPSFNVVNGVSNLVGTIRNAITHSNGADTSKPMAGFDSEGSEGPGYRYTCKNTKAHGGYYYHMTSRKNEVQGVDCCPHCEKVLSADDIESGVCSKCGEAYTEPVKLLKCDSCGETISEDTRKEVRVPYPAIVYANNKMNIVTSINMRMTYLVTNKSDVDIFNVYTNTAYDESVLKELPNAIASYYGKIDYYAMYGKLACLFYAPQNNIDFDGYYSEIWGCVLGDTVTMNCYYQAFHRFNNWRTMDLHIAESGSVYLIPEKTYVEAPDNVDPNNFIYDSSLNPNLPEGAQIFFD